MILIWLEYAKMSQIHTKDGQWTEDLEFSQTKSGGAVGK